MRRDKRFLRCNTEMVCFQPLSVVKILKGVKPDQVLRLNDFEFDQHQIERREALAGFEIDAKALTIKLMVKRFNDPKVTILVLPLDSVYYIELKG